jgi:hypothetical protein
VLTGSAVVSLGLSGCSVTWDDLTSRDFSFKQITNPPNPLVVLQTSQDGDKRARALRVLQEPKQVGGNDTDQDLVVKIMCAAATTEKQPLCRLVAIERLGQFKDPRAVDGLMNAFYNAGAFAPEIATVLRCQALSALGNTGNPAAVELLARVVREPPAEGPESDKQQALDVRIAAARALGKFKHYQATEALVRVLQNEKDVALRDCAYASLQSATGQKLPEDAKAWEDFLHQQQQNPGAPAAEQPKKFSLVGWFSK